MTIGDHLVGWATSDDAVGKTTLLYAWANNKFVPDAEHFDLYAPEIKTPD